MVIAALLGLTAAAEVPLPDYRDALARQQWAAVNERLEAGCATDRFPVVCAEGTVDRVIAEVDAWQRTVGESARLEYLAGLAARYGGREAAAVRRYEHALQLDPGLAEAWYDLGEIRMGRGDLEGARACFEHVAELRTDGQLGWVGPWRLAEVAALGHDPAAFEANLKEALRRGFSLRQIAGQPNWKAFYADPALQDVLDKLLTVYAAPEVRDSLRATPAPAP
ncbi:MAG: tetratricopeptide repeat protein [Myxococcota bacterium]